MSKLKSANEIIIIDNLPPEDVAMLQALYSRDPRSVKTHIEKVKESGPGKFMGRFYVGYGHKSIGDCGTTTLFIEGISLLCAKAVQDWPLYNGQESSTRYLDFSKMTPIDPINTTKSKEIHTKIMNLYNESIKLLTQELKIKYPKKEEESQDIYDKAINARAFDISRCLLPAGVSTMVAWHTNLRQAADHVKIMQYHPLEEVKNVANNILKNLKEKYPYSFSHPSNNEEEKYLAETQKEIAYLKPFEIKNEINAKSYLRDEILDRYKKELTTRPAWTELPNQLKSAGDMVFKFLLDFGSYRDLQRQRSMIAPQPLLTTKFGFHPWYLNQYSNDFRKKIETELSEIETEIKKLDTSEENKQYFIPIGYQVSIEMTASLPSAVYIAELRSGKTVHPTLRIVAQNMAKEIQKAVPNLTLHYETGPDEFTTRRGFQDIVEKKD